MTFAAKLPGRPFQIGDVTMDFAYQEAFPRFNLTPMLSFFTTRWLVIHRCSSALMRSSDPGESNLYPLQQLFADEAIPLDSYSAGSWGPKEADRLIAGSGSLWDNPYYAGRVTLSHF